MPDLAQDFLKATQRVFLAKESAANELAWTIVRALHGGSVEDRPSIDRKVEKLAEALADLID